jgi:hypothetical protein
MPASFSDPVRVQLREGPLLPDVLAVLSNEFSASVDDSAQLKKDAPWKGERSDSSCEIPFPSLCHEFAWRCK